MDDDRLTDLLAEARRDTMPVPPALRAGIVADAAQVATVPSRSIPRVWPAWLGGLIGVPGAALLGLWLGLAQPAAVLSVVPGEADAALLDTVFGTDWIVASLDVESGK